MRSLANRSTNAQVSSSNSTRLPFIVALLIAARSLRRRGYWRQNVELIGRDFERADQCRHQYLDRREVRRAADGREPQFHVTPAGDIFDQHAVRSIAGDRLEHDAAYQHASGKAAFERDPVDALIRQCEVVTPPAVED